MRCSARKSRNRCASYTRSRGVKSEVTVTTCSNRASNQRLPASTTLADDVERRGLSRQVLADVSERPIQSLPAGGQVCASCVRVDVEHASRIPPALASCLEQDESGQSMQVPPPQALRNAASRGKQRGRRNQHMAAAGAREEMV